MLHYNTALQRCRYPLNPFTMTSSRCNHTFTAHRISDPKWLLDSISSIGSKVRPVLNRLTEPHRHCSHPVVVLESAPITTPPSYSTAMMVVWRDDRYRCRQVRGRRGKGTDIHLVVCRWRCEIKTSLSSIHIAFFSFFFISQVFNINRLIKVLFSSVSALNSNPEKDCAIVSRH